MSKKIPAYEDFFGVKYRMPETEQERILFDKDPVRWMEAGIQVNLPHDVLSKAVFQVTAAHGIKANSKEFYIVLAYLALMTSERVIRDFEVYRHTNPNPNFYSKLQELQKP